MKVLKPTTIPFPSSGQFIRNSTATYIEDGILKTAAINEPRWQDGNLLLESESSNRILQSQAINSSPWSGGTRTLAAEFWAGTVPFFKVAKALGTTSEGIRSGSPAVEAGSTWTMTLALLADNKTTCTVGIFANVAEGTGGYWGEPGECTKEIISGPGVFSIYSTAVGSLWHVDGLSDTEPTLIRITRTLAPTSTVTTFSCIVYPGRSTSTTIGDAVKITRVQMEPGFVATSYIPTAATVVTRQADICVGNFSRASTATYIDYQDLFKSSENLQRFSQDIDNVAWGKVNVTVTPNVTTAPDGTMTADTINEGTSATSHYLEQSSFSYIAGEVYTQSAFVKADTASVVQLLFTSGPFGVNAWANFNLLTGTVGTTGVGAITSIENYQNGWYRVSLTATVTSSSSGIGATVVLCNNDINATRAMVYTGTNKMLFVWGVQLEKATEVSSYTPTQGSAVTVYSPKLKMATVDEPRIQNGKLLVEKESVNLKAGSEYFNDTSYWVQSAVNVTPNRMGPDGLNTAMKITETSVNSVHSIISMTSYFGLFTFSLFAKPSGRDWIRLRLGGSTKQAWFNLSTAAVGTIGNQVISNSIEKLASGWCRLSITVNNSTVVTPSISIATADGVESYLGVDSSGLFIFGAQIESTSSPTSYIPTTTTSATRAADIHSSGLVYTNATDARPTWSSATTYAIGQVIRYNNTVYESLQNTNLNKQPDTNPTWWLSLGADNISAAFDGKVGSKTITTDKLRMIIYPGTVVDAIGYLETNASIVNTSAIDSEKTVVYYNSTGVTETSIQNWYDYFFVNPLSDPATQVVHQGIPALDPNLVIGVELINPGTVELGSFLTGQSTTIGKTQYGLKAGIVDYSKKQADEFGNISIIERPYSKRMSGDVYVSNYDLNKVQRFLYNVRATPVLWMASDNPDLAEVSYVYGFYKDFSTTISYPDVSMCSLEIEGLI